MDTRIDCNTIVEGKVDPLNRMVTKLYYSDKEYAIYDVLNSKALCYLTESVKNDLSEISCEVDAVVNIMPNEQIPRYKHRFAKAYKECFEGNIDNAKNILKSIEGSYNREKIDLLKFKYSYIFSACIILLVNSFVSVSVLDFDLKLTDTIKDLYFVGTFGSLGGLISISITVKDINVRFLSEKYLYFFDAIFRMIVSIASAIAVYFIIKGNLILGFLNDMEYTSEIIFIFSILSGFSEHFIPKLFVLMEEKTSSNK